MHNPLHNRVIALLLCAAETVPEDHLYVRDFHQPTPKKFQRAVLKEWESLRENLPDSIWVRGFESRLALLSKERLKCFLNLDLSRIQD